MPEQRGALPCAGALSSVEWGRGTVWHAQLWLKRVLAADGARGGTRDLGLVLIWI